MIPSQIATSPAANDTDRTAALAPERSAAGWARIGHPGRSRRAFSRTAIFGGACGWEKSIQTFSPHPSHLYHTELSVHVTVEQYGQFWRWDSLIYELTLQ